jgi:hypothetical protein
MWYDIAKDHKAVMTDVLRTVCYALSNPKLFQDLEAGTFEEMKKKVHALIESLECFHTSDGLFDPTTRFIMDVVGFGNLVNFSICLAVKDQNPKLLGLLLETVLLLTDDRQIDKITKESMLMQRALDAFGKQSPSWREGFIEGQQNEGQGGTGIHQGSIDCPQARGPVIQSVLSCISHLLPTILPAGSGFSQQTIRFLCSKSLFVSYDSKKGFELPHIDPDKQFFDKRLMVTKDTTTISADSVVCAVSKSERMERSFDHVWLPLSAFRLIYLPLITILNASEKWSYAWLYRIPVILAAIIACAFALLGLTLYPCLLLYFYIMHGFNAYTESGGKTNSHKTQRATDPAQGAEQTESNSQAEVVEQSSASGTNGNGTSTMQCVSNICYKPIVSFLDSLQGTQSVAGHVLSLPGVGSLKSLRMLCTAPIDVFEAPAVRAAVEGMWSRFMIGFFVRFALYLVHLLLFSAFSAWCISQDLSYSTVNSSHNGIVRASLNGGFVAAVICIYFLIREVMQCIACVADEGLKDYIEFWNILQICSLSLELASFVMFVSGSAPATTRLVATYAVFCLWINLLYFTKAIRQISFLLEILVTIVSDMIPFLCIMAVFVVAVTLALLVLVGKMLDPDSGEVVFASFGTPLDLVLRMAEGRQDMGGSVLASLAKAQNNYEGVVPNAISCTLYFCFYFLFFYITIIALNALIALMGSSYEKVMEKKISQRWHSFPLKI